MLDPQTLGILDPRDLLGEVDGWYWPYGIYPPFYRDNSKRGEVIPVYLDENALKAIRDRSRALCSTNEYAICAIDNIIHYCVGTGFTFLAKGIDDDEKELCKQVQKFIDLFCEANDVYERLAESLRREHIDGEAFIRLFPQSDGMTLLRFIEPELVKSLRGTYDAEYSFGIQTLPDDVETIVGYNVIDKPIENYTTTLVPEPEVVHIKLNSRSTAKRGVPTFYPIETNLRRCEQLLANMSSMAKTRAAIAMIRSFNGTQKSTAQTFADNQKEISVNDPTTNVTLNVERMRPGTILNASKNIEYEFPHATSGVSEFVLVLQADLRACAARLNMPEWMFTADASNSNYSSAFVSESACVKMFAMQQDLLARKWGAGRYGQKKSVIWRAIENAIEAGILPEDVKEKVKITVDTPSLIARDGDREASMNKVYLDMRIKSRARIQKELGIVPEEEDAEIKADDLAPDPDGMQPTQGKEPMQTGDRQARMAVTRNYSRVKESFPDIRQDDDVSCGAACSMAVGRFFEVGPETLDGWKERLGIPDRGYVPPEIIVEELEKLGLFAEAGELSVDALVSACRESPVICPIQSEGVGHYVVVLGEALGNFIVHDPEEGSRFISRAEFTSLWHDEADGREYKQYGIKVNSGDEMDRRAFAEMSSAISKLGEKIDAMNVRQFPETLAPPAPAQRIVINQGSAEESTEDPSEIVTALHTLTQAILSKETTVNVAAPVVNVPAAEPVINVAGPVVNVPEQPVAAVHAPVTVTPAPVTVIPADVSPVKKSFKFIFDKKTGRVAGVEEI